MKMTILCAECRTRHAYSEACPAVASDCSGAKPCYSALHSAVGELIEECERRIEHLKVCGLISTLERKTLIKENSQFIERLKKMTQCTCPTLDGLKIRGSACPVHGLPSIPWD